MIAYLVRRLALSALTIVTVSFAAFCIFGISLDPAYTLRMSPDQRPYRFVVSYYHLHDPILVRYWHWLANFVHHGFGRPVSTSVRNTIPRTIDPAARIGPELWHAVGISAQLVGFALLLIVVGSILVGALCARSPGSVADGALRLFAYATWSVPVFLLAFLLGKWLVLPDGSWFLAGPPTGGVVDWFRHMTLPAVAVALGIIGIYARYIRSALLVTLSQQYATVARAKGLSEGRVLRVHALRNSLIPFVSSLSLEIGAIVGASLAADYMFGLGGMASYTLHALGESDPFTLTAIVVTLCAIVMLFVTLADVLVGWLDPRARIAASAG